MSLSHTPTLTAHTNQASGVLNAINDCCQNIQEALNPSFEQVSGFVSKIWSGVKQGGILVDIVVRNLILLEKHLTELYQGILFEGKKFGQEKVLPFLYATEEKIIHYMQENQFFYHTFARIVNGILSLISHLRNNLPISPQYCE